MWIVKINSLILKKFNLGKNINFFFFFSKLIRIVNSDEYLYERKLFLEF